MHRRPFRHAPARQGFTLIEVLIAVMIVGILTTIASASYRDYVMRAQLAQQLVYVDHIRTAVTLAVREGQRDLHQGARAGQVPPALPADLGTQEFQGPDGLRLQLVRWPQQASGGAYALVASVDGAAGERRLGLFQREVDRAGFGNAWLSPHAFVFRIAEDGTGATPAATAAPTAGTVDSAVPATTAVPPQPPASQPAGVPASTLSPGGSTATPSAAASAGTTTSEALRPPATGTTTPTGHCPPGTTPIGNSGQCRSTGSQCPPGMHPVGNSGHCKP